MVEEKKICPIITAGVYAHGVNMLSTEKGTPCFKAQCALWDEKNQKCGLIKN